MKSLKGYKFNDIHIDTKRKLISLSFKNSNREEIITTPYNFNYMPNDIASYVTERYMLREHLGYEVLIPHADDNNVITKDMIAFNLLHEISHLILIHLELSHGYRRNIVEESIVDTIALYLGELYGYDKYELLNVFKKYFAHIINISAKKEAKYNRKELEFRCALIEELLNDLSIKDVNDLVDYYKLRGRRIGKWLEIIRVKIKIIMNKWEESYKQ